MILSNEVTDEINVNKWKVMHREKNNLYCSYTVMDSKLTITTLEYNLKDPENINEMLCLLQEKK